MRNGRSDDRYTEQILLCVFFRLADRIRYFVCLAGTKTNASFLITDDDQSSEAETASTLDYLGYTVDRYDTCLKFFFAITISSWFPFA